MGRKKVLKKIESLLGTLANSDEKIIKHQCDIHVEMDGYTDVTGWRVSKIKSKHINITIDIDY